ncbi:hypothetical protein [Micromonospora haikouensis]
MSQDRRGTLTVGGLDELPRLTGIEGRSQCLYTEIGAVVKDLSGEECPTH